MIPAHVPGSPACTCLGEAARLGCIKHFGGFVDADAAVSQHVASTTINTPSSASATSVASALCARA
eukprot:1401158-Prymnesium_polylepis.1